MTALWEPLTNLAFRSDAKLSFKANLPPSATAEFAQLAASLSGDLVLQAHAGNGIVIGHVDDLTLDQARAMLAALLDAGGPEGNVVITRCPAEWKRELPIWGKPRGDYWLMRRVKEALDPRGVFNPGRFVDGI